jgi:hypothetical protein
MDAQPTRTWDWLAMHDAPAPPGVGQPLPPERLAAYLDGVEARLHRLALVVEGMRECLEAVGLLSEAQLLAKIEEIDLRDGLADGRHGRDQRSRCGACGRINTGVRRRCLYCGSQDLHSLADSPA